MNTNRKDKKVKETDTKKVEVKKPKTIKVKFKSRTKVSWKIYNKDQEYTVSEKLLDLIKNFIY